MNTSELNNDNLIAECYTSHKIDVFNNVSNPHSHDSFEIFYSNTPNLKFFINDKFYQVEKGDLLVFNNHDIHKILAPIDTVCDRFIVVFNPEFAEMFSSEQTRLLQCFYLRDSDFYPIRHLNVEQEKEFMTFFNKLTMRMCAGKGAGYIYGNDLLRTMSLVELLIFVNSLFLKTDLKSKTLFRPELKKIETLINYINRNLENHLSLTLLAELFGYSKNHLNVLFIKATGFSIGEFIIFKRVARAKKMLTNGTSVTETALASGFLSLSNFMKCFKAMTGLSPKRFARREISRINHLIEDHSSSVSNN